MSMCDSNELVDFSPGVAVWLVPSFLPNTSLPLPLSFPSLPSLPLSFPSLPSLPSLCYTVEATITNGLPPQISVTVGDPLELNCTASGHELDISWSLGGKTYSLSDECRNGVCVHFERINDLTLTSHLTLTSIDTASPRETPVECIVRQELPEVFSAEVKRSASRIVITDGQISCK